MSDQPANVNVRLALEQSALQQSSQGVDKLKQQFADLKSQTQSSGASADSALKGMVSDASAATSEINRLNSALDATSKTAEKVGSSKGFNLESTRRIGGALGGLGLGDVGGEVQKVGDLAEVIKGVGAAGAAAGIALGPAVLALGAVGAAVGVVTLLQKNYNDELKRQEQQLKNLLDAQQQYAHDLYTLTTKDAQKAVEDAKVQRRIADEMIGNARQLIIDQAKKEEDASYLSGLSTDRQDTLLRARDNFKLLYDALDKAQSSVDSDTIYINLLRKGLEDNVFAANDAAEAEKHLGEVRAKGGELVDSEVTALKNLNKEVQDAQKAAQDRANKEVEVVKKLDDQLASVEDNAAQQRIAINEKLHDTLVKAAEDALAASQKALDQLTQKREQTLQTLQRGNEQADRQSAAKELDDRINAQRQERDDLVAHLDNLKQIRDRDASRERDDLLNRNYRDLFALKEQKTQDINSENDRYTDQKRQRAQALDDQLSDLKRADAQGRLERLISYQQANADAQRQYQSELIQAQEAKQKAIQQAQQASVKELNDLHTATVQKEAILRQGAVNELNLVTQTEQAKQQIFQAYLDRAREMLGQTSTGAFNRPINVSAATPFADGGPISAYQSAFVNEPGSSGNEGFNGMKFPRSMGLFIPAQSGRIDSGKKSSETTRVYTNTYNIVSHDPQGVKREVLDIMKRIAS